MKHRKKKESEIRKQGRLLLEAAGFLVLPLNDFRAAGYPDDMVMRDGITSFIEWKRPGGVVSNVQEQLIDKIRQKGVYAGVFYSVEDCKEFLRKFNLATGHVKGGKNEKDT